MKLRCEFCHGTGISDVIWHQDENGNSEMEPIRCKNCDGAGYVDVADSEVMRKEYGL